MLHPEEPLEGQDAEAAHNLFFETENETENKNAVHILYEEVARSRKEAARCREEAAGYRKEAAGYRKEAAGYREEAASYREEAASYREEVASSREEAARLTAILKIIIEELGNSETDESFIEYLAPSQELIEHAVNVLELEPSGAFSWHFEQCARSVKPNVDLEFMRWFAQRYGVGSRRDHWSIFRAFRNACSHYKFDIAKWIFTAFNLATDFEHILMRELVSTLREGEQNNSPRSQMASWIVGQLDAAINNPS